MGNDKTLTRKEILSLEDEASIWHMSLSDNDVLDLLNDFKTKLNDYAFNTDSDFVMNDRRVVLSENIDRFIETKESGYLQHALRAIWEFISDDYGNSFKYIVAQTGDSFEMLKNADDRYRSRGIVCLEEKNIILELVQKIIDSMHQ